MMPRIALVLLVVLLVAADGAVAQDAPPPVIEFGAGWIGFADDGVVSESMVGGAARWYATPRLSIGPELVYISGRRHSHLVVTGNVTCDLLRDTRSTGSGVIPFLVAGGGLFRTREQFFTDTYTSSEGAFTAGGGLRARLNDRVNAGIDARIGWELHLRVNGLIGVRLGR